MAQFDRKHWHYPSEIPKLEAEAESDYEEIDSQVNINAKVVKNTSKEEKPE